MKKKRKLLNLLKKKKSTTRKLNKIPLLKMKSEWQPKVKLRIILAMHSAF